MNQSTWKRTSMEVTDSNNRWLLLVGALPDINRSKVQTNGHLYACYQLSPIRKL